jgi:antirestriction protein ArdC
LQYAKEELRAELTSVFLMAERGIPHVPDSHAAYLGSWLKGLREDKHEIFRAARDAHKAADLLIALELHKSLDQALANTNGTHQSIDPMPDCLEGKSPSPRVPQYGQSPEMEL